MSASNQPRRWFKRSAVVACALLIPVVLFAAALVAFQQQADASSHREAPAISKDQFADNTDTYVFISPESDDNVVFVANWIPFEGPEGGPNYYEWDPAAVYEIYVDTDGNATANVTYTLSSRVVVANPNTFLYNTNTINEVSDPDWNRRQYITVTETLEDGTINNLVANELTAPVNIGSKSTPNYDELERVFTSGDVKIFAGQADDPFWVDLQVFDLLTLRGQEPPIGYEVGNNIPVDSVSGFNVHSLVIEIPIARIQEGAETVFGVWAATRRATVDVLASGTDAITFHTYNQVSRLGMPLVNEVVIPYALKDAFNTLKPSQDAGIYTADNSTGNLLQKSVEDPEIGRLLCGLYGVPLPGDANDDCSTEVGADPRTGRGDIFDIFLTGMVLENDFTINTANGPVTLSAPFTVNRPSGVVPAEMIRINTAIKGDLCAPSPSRLGVLGGDACGFPNGRRLTDDVVEIELLAVAGAAYEVLDDRDDSFTFNADFIEVLDDGVDTNDKPFREEFPYLALAQSGQEHIHENPVLAILLPLLQKGQVAASNLGAQPWIGFSSLLAVALIIPALVIMRRRTK